MKFINHLGNNTKLYIQNSKEVCDLIVGLEQH